jgi:hypothetical protein
LGTLTPQRHKVNNLSNLETYQKLNNGKYIQC